MVFWGGSFSFWFAGKKNDVKVDLSTIKDLIEDSVVSTQPAMMVNLKACTAGSNVVRLS